MYLDLSLVVRLPSTFAYVAVEWAEPMKQVTEFWDNSNERIVRFLMSHLPGDSYRIRRWSWCQKS